MTSRPASVAARTSGWACTALTTWKAGRIHCLIVSSGAHHSLGRSALK